MAAGRPIAEVVDDLLTAPKYLSGQGFWRQGTSDRTQRLVYPVLLQNGGDSCELSTTARLWSSTPWYCISLIYRGERIWGLDMDPDTEIHINPIEPGNGLSGLTIRGPHYHAWADNKHLASHTILPRELPWRRSTARSGWDVGLRWFLAEVGIDQPESYKIPAYPERASLL